MKLYVEAPYKNGQRFHSISQKITGLSTGKLKAEFLNGPPLGRLIKDYTDLLAPIVQVERLSVNLLYGLQNNFLGNNKIKTMNSKLMK